MVTLAIVDAGPLDAAADADDVDHEPSVRALSRGDLRLVVPALVVAEATYFVGRGRRFESGRGLLESALQRGLLISGADRMPLLIAS
jgi:hypothetical protein